jgi:hypothetical protein
MIVLKIFRELKDMSVITHTACLTTVQCVACSMLSQ